MVYCIQYRVQSPLKSPIWRTANRGSIEDYELSLYDIGIDTGSLLGDAIILIKALKEPHSSNPSPISCEEFLRRVLEADASLEAWWNDFVAWAPKPLFWQEQQVISSRDVPHTDQEPFLQSISAVGLAFPDLRLAHLCMDLWAVHLNLCTTFDRTMHHLRAEVAQTPGAHIFMTTSSRHDTAFQLAMATSILDSMSYVSRPEMGYVGAQKSLFAIRVALSTFRCNPGPYADAQAEKVASVMKRMAPAYGLKLAEVLESQLTDWDLASGTEELKL